jgi:hypothetical protein
MKRVHFLVLFGLVLTSQGLPAQTPKPAPKPSGRYLLIVETSTLMRRRAVAVQDAVRSLLRSGLNGQLRRGDTLGIWTFNEELYAGRFPLQSWVPESREDVAQAGVEFLKKQRYEKQARLESMFPELQQVINSSETITVLLISTGESEMTGTPFDQQINATYAQWRREMQRTQMPFITVLRARNGQMASHIVNMAPWPVEFPAFTPGPQPAVAAQPPQAVAVEKPAPVVAPKPRAPIILDMSRPATDTTKEPAKTEVGTTGQGSVPLKPAAETTVPKVDRAEIPQPAQVPPVSITAPKLESPPVTPPQDLTSSPAVSPPLVAPTTDAAALTESRHRLEQRTTGFGTEPVKTQPAEPVAPVAEKLLPQPPPLKLAELVAPPAPEDKPAAAQTPAPEPLSPPDDSGASAGSQMATPATLPTAPGQAAVTTPGGALSSTKTLLVAAAVLLAVVAGLLLLFLRRARTAQHSSLITRSMERRDR